MEEKAGADKKSPLPDENRARPQEKEPRRAKRLWGKPVSEKLELAMQKDLRSLEEAGIRPTLATIQIGEDGPSLSYAKAIHKKAQALGIQVQALAFPAESEDAILEKKIKELGRDPFIHAILLFRPLLGDHDSFRLQEAIPVEKDIDGLSLGNQGKLLAGRPDAFVSPAAQAVIEMLQFYQIPIQGRDVLLLGRGPLVGRPLSILLADRGATVTVGHRQSKDLAAKARQAQILISASGFAGLVDVTFVHPGQIVLDLGLSPREGKLSGDLDQAAVESIVGAFSPTPGGVGRVTSTVLLRAVLQAAQRSQGPKKAKE